ncbi:hypothetical protein QTH97_36350 [Variovorax sp. J22R24]|uniref:hypothetical protein n=1 Tax=Variovorax gracilis TaxID=3053502 RepID=UPI002579106F|nr:hypothetical protein [Variovorax sp. J22R24]MDM0110404.1 hypothetical protein [Variovorax sp. J22R24]
MNTPRNSGANEEPELGADESIPLDGKDPKGEEMMKELGRDLKKRGDGGDTEGNSGTSSPTKEEAGALLEKARTEAQLRVADVHSEEGTVKSEKAQNSPHPDDHD